MQKRKKGIRKDFADAFYTIEEAFNDLDKRQFKSEQVLAMVIAKIGKMEARRLKK